MLPWVVIKKVRKQTSEDGARLNAARDDILKKRRKIRKRSESYKDTVAYKLKMSIEGKHPNGI